MNDAYLGGGDTSGLEELARAVQDAAARASIEENPSNELVPDAATAEARAIELGQVTHRSNGVISAHRGGPVENTVDIYPMDSEAYKEIHDSFSWIVDLTEFFSDLPANKTGPAEEIEEIKQKFDPEGYVKALAANNDSESEEKTDADDLETLAKDSHWASMNTVYRRLGHWSGKAAEDFKTLWVDQQDIRLIGQLSAIEVSRQVLCVANIAYREGQASARSVLEKAEKAFDELLSSSDVSWDAVLTVVSALATFGGGVAATVAAPATFGASGIAGLTGIAAGVSSFCGFIAGQTSDSDDPEKKQKLSIGGSTAEAIGDSLAKALNKIKDQIVDVETETYVWLQEMMDGLTEVALSAVPLSTGEQDLSVRECYFEAPAPGMAKMQPYLDSADDGLTESEAKAAGEEVFDVEVLGTSDEEVSVSIDRLEEMGKTILPAIADVYSEVGKSISSITDPGASAFREGRSVEILDQWRDFNETVAEFFSNTSSSFQLLSDIMALGAEAIRTVDEDSARSIWETTDDFAALKDG